MTGSRNKLHRLLPAGLAAILAVVTLLPAPGVAAPSAVQLAQTGPPLLLMPIEPPQPRGPGSASSPPAKAIVPSAGPVIKIEPEVAESPIGGAGVEVDTLQAPDPESVGLLDPSQGGFDVDFWRGTSRRLVQRLLPKIRTSGQSATARRLLRRMLLSRVRAPEGKSGGESLLKIRVRHLLEMGDVKSAVSLLRAAPPQLNDEDLFRLEVEGRFFLNDNAGACTRVRRLVQQYSGSYWQQSTAFCHSLAKEHVRSAMIADLLRERTSEVPPAFFVLVEALAGEPNLIVQELKNPGGLVISMMRAASVKLPPATARSPRPLVLRAVALSPNAELETRLEAAERAEAEGALTTRELTEIYASVPFDAAELADPSAVADIWNPRSRALLIRAAAAREAPGDRAAVLSLAWKMSGRHGGHGTLLRASIPILMSIQPAAELVGFAGAAGHSLFATGNFERALAWFRLAEGNAKTSRAAAAAWIRLWPLAQLATGGESTIDRHILAQWRNYTVKADEVASGPRTRLLYTLFDAMGQDVGASAWRELVGKGKIVAAGGQDPALWHALRAAASEPRVGESVLLALLALSGSDAVGPTPLTLNAVIAALRSVGLEDEARSLAVESAVASGI